MRILVVDVPIRRLRESGMNRILVHDTAVRRGGTCQ